MFAEELINIILYSFSIDILLVYD
ncbi:hypothetical protein THF5G08_280018 [Vibrio jasicida]|nr:hypothetical protein THF5G08_280018 [Vibrio jasicida]